MWNGEPGLGGNGGKPKGSQVEHGRPKVCHEWGEDKGHELWRWQATLPASIKLVPLGRTGKRQIIDVIYSGRHYDGKPHLPAA